MCLRCWYIGGYMAGSNEEQCRHFCLLVSLQEPITPPPLEMRHMYTNTSVADPGSGAFQTLDPDPGSGIGFYRIPDLGSRIPTPYFLGLSDKFLGKKFYNSLKTGPIFFLQHLKNKIILNFCEICGYKKRFDNKFFSSLSFVAIFGSGILDQRSGIRNG